MTPLFEYYIDGVALTTISTFGIIGTLLSLRVLLKRQLRNSFSSLLSGLAVSDTLFLFFAVLIIGLPKTSEWFNTELSVYTTPIAFGFMGIARTGSVYCTVCVTLERYYATAKPFASNKWIKKRLMPAAFLFAILYNIPKFFELRTHHSVFTNQTMIVASAMRHNAIYISVYLTWMKIIIMEAIPYVTILTLNICILKKVYNGSKFRKSFKTDAKVAAKANGGKTKFYSMSYHRRLTSSTRRQTSLPDLEGSFECSMMATVELGGATEVTPQQIVQELKYLDEQIPDIVAASVSPRGDDEENRIEEIVELKGQEDVEGQPRRSLTERSHSETKINGVVVPSITRHLEQERTLAITLVFISILFITCQSFKIIPDLFEFMCERVKSADQCMSIPIIDYFVSVGNLMPCINSAVNFLIYMLRGKKFRDAFCSTYDCYLKFLRNGCCFLHRGGGEVIEV